MKITNILFLFSLIGIMINAKESNSPESFFKNSKERMVFMEKAFNYGFDYKIEGTITDDKGNILNDVMVQLRKYNDSMNPPAESENKLIKNGKISFSHKSCYSWILTFRKSGYYDTQIGFTLPLLDKLLDSGQAKLEGNTIVRNETVILKPLLQLSKNLFEIKYHKLTYMRKEELKEIFAFSIPYNRSAKEDTYKFKYVDEKELPKNLIYIVPDQGKKNIILKTNAPDSGFLQLSYEGRSFFTNMFEAPETGDYKPELIIDKANTKEEFIVFYYKVMGYYGKGLIMQNEYGTRIEENNASIQCYFFISKKKGDRNMITGLYRHL